MGHVFEQFPLQANCGEFLTAMPHLPDVSRARTVATQTASPRFIDGRVRPWISKRCYAKLIAMWDTPPRGYVYVMGPIDWWPGWSELDEAAAPQSPDDADARTHLERVRDHALEQFPGTGWEGDIIAGPLFAGLPPSAGSTSSDVLVAIKQMNNGMVFVWSPRELPWLDENRA